MWLMPRALAATPIARVMTPPSSVSNASVMYSAIAASLSRYLAASNGFDFLTLDLMLSLLLVLCSQAFGSCDVSALRPLVSSGQQQDVSRAALYVIDSISRPVADAQLTDPLANGRDITWIATGEPLDTDQDLGFGTRILQLAEPCRELLRLADVEHGSL